MYKEPMKTNDLNYVCADCGHHQASMMEPCAKCGSLRVVAKSFVIRHFGENYMEECFGANNNDDSCVNKD